MKWDEPIISLPISDILKIEGNLILVEAKNGEVVALPMDKIEPVPGAVRLPAWLAKKHADVIRKCKSEIR